jgi:hypothetical protein
MSDSDLPTFATWIETSKGLVSGDSRIAKTFPVMGYSYDTLNTHYNGNPRLGFLYQELCKRLFDDHPHYQMIAEEVQLQQDKRTIGAIDFLLKNTEENRVEHWEVAIKFYLLKQGRWYGPNAKDRLDIKLSRMLEHQLTMTNTKAFQILFPEFEQITKHLLMQGRLYVNPFESEDVPTNCLGLPIEQQNITGLWCYQSQFTQITEPLYKLKKPYWATGLKCVTDLTPIIELPEHFIHCQSKSGQFWFIVPDDWPNNV